MTFTKEVLDAIIEVAVVKAMNTGAAAFGIARPADGSDAAKQKLTKLVTAEVRDNGTVVLALDSTEADMVGPLYCVFSASWGVKQVRESVLEFMRKAPVLEGVNFDLQMLTM